MVQNVSNYSVLDLFCMLVYEKNSYFMLLEKNDFWRYVVFIGQPQYVLFLMS